MMKIVPNQRISVLHKAKSDKEHPYSIVNIACMENAMKDLTGNEFKIFMALISDQDGYSQAISTAELAKRTGADKREIQRRINSLIEKGYMVQDEVQSNKYHIYEERGSYGDNQHSEKNDTVENTIGLCGNTTCSCGEKRHHSTDNTTREILQDIQDTTLSNTKTFRIDRNTDQNEPTSMEEKVIALYKSGKKYNRNNPEIQRETGLSGTAIYDIIHQYKQSEIDEARRKAEERILNKDILPTVSIEKLYTGVRGYEIKRNARIEVDDLW